jgi:hypothetical protein
MVEEMAAGAVMAEEVVVAAEAAARQLSISCTMST